MELAAEVVEPHQLHVVRSVVTALLGRSTDSRMVEVVEVVEAVTHLLLLEQEAQVVVVEGAACKLLLSMLLHIPVAVGGALTAVQAVAATVAKVAAVWS